MKSDVSHVLFVGLGLCCVAPVAALARVESDIVREEQGVEADAGVQGVIDIAGDMTAASVEIDPVPIGTVVEFFFAQCLKVKSTSYSFRWLHSPILLLREDNLSTFMKKR